MSGGECTTANAGTTLIDVNGSFSDDNVNAGDVVVNLTDGSSAVVTSVTNNSTLVHEALSGGLENDWDVDDLYAIGTKIQLTGTFSASKSITITPDSPTAPVQFMVDDIQYGNPTSFLVYGFDFTGEEVSEPFLWNFEGV